MASARTSTKKIVLIGGGHAHLQAIKGLNCVQRPDGVDVVLIDPQDSAFYSGMVPGCVSGLYTAQQTQVELGPLSSWAQIQHIQSCVVDLDLKAKEVICADGRRVPYDVCSFDVGSSTRFVAGSEAIPGVSTHGIPTRPISNLTARLDESEARFKAEGRSAVAVVVVGGGAAGIELAFGVKARWAQLGDVTVTLLDSGAELLPQETPQVRNLVTQQLKRRGIEIVHGVKVKSVDSDRIETQNGRVIQYTPGALIWATGAASHPLAKQLAAAGLPITPHGWIRVDRHLRSVSDASIFAAGDCASVELADGRPPPPKAGVYAVRSGPIILHNLVASLAGRPLLEYQPQDEFLKLLMCGDGYAIGIRFSVAFYGRWVWSLKDAIDQSFMDLFHKDKLPPLETLQKGDAPIEQYDAHDEDPCDADAALASQLILTSPEQDRHERAWAALRRMMYDLQYRSAVLDEIRKLQQLTPC